jgi:hypothetical protein
VVLSHLGDDLHQYADLVEEASRSTHTMWYHN